MGKIPDAPSYAWQCQSCHAANAAQTKTCASCGFSAAFTTAQLREAKGEEGQLSSHVIEQIVGLVLIICIKVLWSLVPIPDFTMPFGIGDKIAAGCQFLFGK